MENRNLETLAQELGLKKQQVETVLELTAEGNTIPFIARYRKEKTGNLDETQIKAIIDMDKSLTTLQDRKETVLAKIEAQGKLTDHEDLSVDVDNIAVHHAVFIVEDAECRNFFDEPIGIFLRVDRLDAQENEQTCSDLTVECTVYFDRCVSYALKNDSHICKVTVFIRFLRAIADKCSLLASRRAGLVVPRWALL